jgi:hypothetical protein
VAVDELDRQTRLACVARPSVAARHVKGEEDGQALARGCHSPTALLPTMAIFLCLGAGILLLGVWEVLAEAERLASVERFKRVAGGRWASC